MSVSNVQHLGSKDLATRYQVHVGTIARWRVLGYGPRFIKMGKSILYSLEEIEKWERSQIRRSTSDTGQHVTVNNI